ncbi:hypothetical protein TanjilG_13769 [Lupinus angustifolius]|uniref:RING-type domain-containing protein n=1 Tax=Lupinus angustifolius TaxID=3871 RepID=A0A1J7GND4_LUPAN|nr:PREDICTED: E3 ubiquitin-protein ligase RHA1B [Lupinus angustifolius]OIW02031.1 hypothetical protein TanjilG_13769 [Lupinus angustifolius]
MGFPVGYTQVFFPNLFLHILIFLGFLRNLVFILFHYLGLSDLLETDVVWPEPTRIPDTKKSPSLSAILIRELLPAIQFSDLDSTSAAVTAAESGCAVCLYEFSGEDEIRCLRNCKHIFHRGCVDRWIDHDQKTCPLCRTPFVPDEMIDDYNQRLWAASGVAEFYAEYSTSF